MAPASAQADTSSGPSTSASKHKLQPSRLAKLALPLSVSSRKILDVRLVRRSALHCALVSCQSQQREVLFVKVVSEIEHARESRASVVALTVAARNQLIPAPVFMLAIH